MPVRLSLLVVAALLAVCQPAVCGEDDGAPRPVSVRELSLLLRSGYTGGEVLQETAGRPLLDPIDATAERNLLDAGADARTVAALRSGRRIASAAEADDLRQQQAAADQYRLDAWEGAQARRLETNRQATQAKLAARRDEQLKRVAAGLYDKLVIFKEGRLGPYDNAALAEKKLFLLYAAGSEKTSRQWTPRLVEFYREFAPAHPEFEVILVSADGSAAEMERSMKQAAMPWPALGFDQLAARPDLASMGEAGLPRLVLIEGSGTKIADNVEDGKFLSPQHVLDVLTGKGGGTGAPTATK